MDMEVKKLHDIFGEIDNPDDFKKVADLYSTPFTRQKACEFFNVFFSKNGLSGFNGDIQFTTDEMIFINTTRRRNDSFFPFPATMSDFIYFSVSAGLQLNWNIPLSSRLSLSKKRKGQDHE